MDEIGDEEFTTLFPALIDDNYCFLAEKIYMASFKKTAFPSPCPSFGLTAMVELIDFRKIADVVDIFYNH